MSEERKELDGTGSDGRSGFLSRLRHSYNRRRKSAVVLTGGVTDIFPLRDSYLPLEQTLYQEFHRHFVVVRMDAATGLSFYSEADRTAALETGQKARLFRREEEMTQLIDGARHNPLVALTILRRLAKAARDQARVNANIKPLLIVVQDAGALFPPGEWAQLSEIDRQRLTFFLNWLRDPLFGGGANLMVLISDTRAELNDKLLAESTVDQIEIPLPDDATRSAYVQAFLRDQPVRFTMEQADFVRLTTGLELTSVRDLLNVAAGTGEPLTKNQVITEVNNVLRATLGDVVRLIYPEHTPADIIGYEETGRILRQVFERCKVRRTAVSAFLVSGPNGVGKSFQLEAYAGASGWIVIELTGIRDKWYGGTDEKWERLRWFITTFGQVLIMVDEAHTAFGDVHSGTEHTTEKRLAGNMIKLMGDRRFLGKALWAQMTSRPDELNADVKSRSPIQIPIFDLEGDERRDFVREMFRREGLTLTDEDLDGIIDRTGHYSARDYGFFVAETLAMRSSEPQITPLQVLDVWTASSAIILERRFQSLVAARHCSYPGLLPDGLRDRSPEEIQEELDALGYRLYG